MGFVLGFYNFQACRLHAKPGGHLIGIGRFCFCFCLFLIRKVLGLGLIGGGGFAASDPVVTSFSLAGFAGGRRPHAPGGRTPIPAAFR